MLGSDYLSESTRMDRSRHYLQLFAIYPRPGQDEKLLRLGCDSIGLVPSLINAN